MKYLLPLLLLATSLGIVLQIQAKAVHPELGNVAWLRDYDEALEVAKTKKKPLLILFQEVPGCAGCVNYGEGTLSHPLIVDAIESSFVPLAIFNNQGGSDKIILQRFKEPAWNFQVMRFIDADGNDIIPRKDRVWSPGETAVRMIEALEAVEQPVPEYLRTVAWTSEAAGLKTAVFSMHCFWDGEAKLGGIEGVVETDAGWLNCEEVVKLRYDPTIIEWKDLVAKARSYGCAKRVYTEDAKTLDKTPKGSGTRVELFSEESFRMARSSDQKRHLQFSKLKELALNPVQRTKINAALSLKDPDMIQKWLSPTQLEAINKSM